MKSAIACFLSASKNYLKENKNFKGKISLFSTVEMRSTFAVEWDTKNFKVAKEKKELRLIIV